MYGIHLQMNLPEAVKQADFLGLSPPRFNSFLSSGWVCVMKPEVKLFLIISWLGYDVKERQQYLVLLLRYIDWSTVADDFLNEISQTENFFTTHESSLYLLLQTLFSSSIPLGPYADSFADLRDKYAYLLDHIVQNSYVLPLEPEEYYPVAYHVLNAPSELLDSDPLPPLPATSERGNGIASGSAGRDSVYVEEEDAGRGGFFYLPDAYDLSNDSVTAGIGLGMRQVSIVESQLVMPGARTAPPPAVPPLSGGKTRKKPARARGGCPAGKVSASTAPVSGPSPSCSPAPSRGQSGAKRKSKRSARSAPPAHPQDDGDKSVLSASGRKRKRAADKSVSAKEKPSPAKVLRPAKIHAPAEVPSPTLAPSPANTPSPAKGKSSEGGVRRRVAVKPSPVKEEPSEAASTQLNGRPKRQAAAKFSIPDKLMPRLRKTKAVLKQVLVPEPIDREEAERDKDGDSMGYDNRASDSDDYGDNNDDVYKDSAADPDYSLPKKATRSTKTNAKASSIAKLSGSSPKIGGGAQKFTSVKRKGAPQSVLRSILTDPEPAPQPKEEPEPEGEAGGEWSEEEGEEGSGGDRDRDRGVVGAGGDAQSKRKCSQCEYWAHTQRRLANHTERVHGSRATLFVCSLCPFECQWNKRFYDHMKQHFQGPPYTCDFEGCAWQAERIQVLLIHRRRHTGERPHKCPQCSARFKTRNNLIAHFKCHSGKKSLS